VEPDPPFRKLDRPQLPLQRTVVDDPLLPRGDILRQQQIKLPGHFNREEQHLGVRPVGHVVGNAQIAEIHGEIARHRFEIGFRPPVFEAAHAQIEIPQRPGRPGLRTADDQLHQRRNRKRLVPAQRQRKLDAVLHVRPLELPVVAGVVDLKQQMVGENRIPAQVNPRVEIRRQLRRKMDLLQTTAEIDRPRPEIELRLHHGLVRLNLRLGFIRNQGEQFRCVDFRGDQLHRHLAVRCGKIDPALAGEVEHRCFALLEPGFDPAQQKPPFIALH